MRPDAEFNKRIEADRNEVLLGDRTQYVWMFHDVSMGAFGRRSLIKLIGRAAWISGYIGWPWLLVLLSLQFTNGLALFFLFFLLPVQLLFAAVQNRMHMALGTAHDRDYSAPEIFTALGAIIFLVGASGGALSPIFTQAAEPGFMKGALYMLHHLLNTLTFGVIENLGYSLSSLEPIGWRGRLFETATIVFVVYSIARFIIATFFSNRGKEVFVGTPAQAAARASQRGGLDDAYVSRVRVVQPIRPTVHRASELSQRLTAAEGLEDLLSRLRNPMFGTYLVSIIFGFAGTGRFGVRYWALQERNDQRFLVIHHTKFIPHAFSSIAIRKGQLIGITALGEKIKLAKFDAKNLPVDWQDVSAVLLYVYRSTEVSAEVLPLTVS